MMGWYIVVYASTKHVTTVYKQEYEVAVIVVKVVTTASEGLTR